MWLPVYVLRYSNVPTAQVGWWLGVSELVQMASKLGGSFVIEVLIRHDVRWFAWQCVLGKSCLLPLMAWWFALPLHSEQEGRHALMLLSLPLAFNGLQASPQSTMEVTLGGTHAQGLGASIAAGFAKVGGLFIGVPIVGILADMLQPSMGEVSLRLALKLVVLTAISLSIVAYAAAAPNLKADLEGVGVGREKQKAGAGRERTLM